MISPVQSNEHQAKILMPTTATTNATLRDQCQNMQDTSVLDTSALVPKYLWTIWHYWKTLRHRDSGANCRGAEMSWARSVHASLTGPNTRRPKLSSAEAFLSQHMGLDIFERFQELTFWIHSAGILPNSDNLWRQPSRRIATFLKRKSENWH